ncbi:MAG: hypothetical protein ABJA67_15545 [Chthonomonadales bacterium]
MKNAYIKHLVTKYVDPHFTGYNLQGFIYFCEPIEYVLRGYCFDSGRNADLLKLMTFVQPLYTPCDFIALTLGETIVETFISKDNEEKLMPEIVKKMKDFEPYLFELATPRELTHLPRQTKYENNSDVACERRAYSRILNGEYEEARIELNILIGRLNDHVVAKIAARYEFEALDRAEELIRLLDINSQLALDKLDEYTAFTKSHLRLP